jgi:NAD(P)-dependent dehydrogenase (short-subunit alcohol dehydrogenase family)
MAERLKVLVTGASSGIGRAAAVEFARRGHDVFAGARRAEELGLLAAEQERIEPVRMDVTDHESVAGAVARVDELTEGYGIDALINSAGYALGGPVEVLSGKAVEHQFQTNVFGLLDVTRAFLPKMRSRGSGRIVNVSSVVGRVAFPGMGVYAATKFALEALSDALRMELAAFGVKVILIEPGFVKTGIDVASQRQAAEFPPAADGYEDMIERVREFVGKQVAENGIPAERVGRQIVEAVEARNPRARYLLPVSSKALVHLMTALPAGAADRAKALATR